MSLKPSIGQIVNPFFLQDGQDANPSAVSYPLNVADGVKGGSSAVDPLSLDIAGLPAGTLATTTELAINNGTVNEKTTLSDLATFLGGGGTPSDLAVKVATTAVLPGTPTYDNGTSGVGATLTRSSNGTTGAIDGVAAASLVAGDYILVKNQAAQLQNGVYEITQQGTASLPYILTRVTEADTSAEFDDLVVTAALGTTNKGIPYGQQTNNPIIGTNNIVFTATGIYMRQQTSGTQAINQIPVYTATGLTQTKGTANFKYNPANDLFTIRGIDYTFPANNGDASQVLTTDGAGNLSWATGGRDVYSVADITALNAITGMDTGDVAIVANTFDDTGENVSGSYIYNGTSWLLQSWYNVYLNTLLDVNTPSPVAGDILQWNGTQWINVANAFAPIDGTPTEVRYFDNAGVDFSDPLFTRDSVTNHTEATREYDSTATNNQFTVTVPVSFLTANTNGTFNIGDQVETQFGEAQAEVLDVGTVTTTEPQYTNLAYSGVGLNDLTSIYVGGYTGSYPVSYTMEILQNNVAYSGIGTVNGTLSIGDTITGLTSGATAIIVAIDTYKNILAVDTIVGTFIPAEIVEGNTPSDFLSIGGDFSTVADIILLSNTNANSVITTIAPSSQLEGVEISFSSFTGHTIGDTWTFDISPTSTSFVVYLTNVTGILPITETRLNNLTTPFQTDDGDILDASFTVGDTVNIIDLSSGFNQVGQIEITQTSGQDFNYTVNSGTIAIGNYLYGPSVDKVGFIYNLTSNIVNKTINTGFRTEPIQFPNVPFIIEGSAIVATDGVDKMAVGVFDLSVSGQSELSAGIVAHYGDSSQSTFTTQKGFANLNLFDSTTNKSLDVNYSGDEFTIQGYNNIIDFGLSINGNRLSYNTNGTQFTFPTSIGGIGYIVADVNGNGTLTLEPISSLIGPIVNKTTDTDPLFTGTLFSLMHIPSFIYGVYVNGVYQNEGADYTISGVDITFTTTIVSSYVTVVYEYL